MESTILNSILDLQVPSECLPQYQDEEQLVAQVLGDWIHFSRLVSHLSRQLSALCPKLDETVTEVKVPSEDLSSFKVELSTLLKELAFPHMDNPNLDFRDSLATRFERVESRRLVLFFLLAEVQAARILYTNNSEKGANANGLNVKLEESPTASVLRELCQELDLGKPPENVSVAKVWAGILAKVKARLGGPSAILNPLLPPDLPLTPDQFGVLEWYFKELWSEYGMRREMLLQRLDVTVQSFKWKSEKDKDGKLDAAFKKIRAGMKVEPGVKLSHIFAAREDLPAVEKTSGSRVRKNTRSEVNKVVIGKVPDRGGRPDEVEPPPPEMPSWQQRQQGPPGSSGWIKNPNSQGGGPRGGGGGGGGRGGGRVQGGWSGHGGGGHHQQQQQHYQQGGGSGGGGGHHQQQQHYQGGGGGGGGYQQRDNYYQHDNRDGGGQYRGGGGGGGGYQHQDNRGGGSGGWDRDNQYQGQGQGRGGGRGGRGRRY